jgi:hypothetical protein
VRSLEIWDAGIEDVRRAFHEDHAMIAVAAAERGALSRLWRRPQPCVALGRYHRMRRGAGALERRLTGGRAVPVGPGILGWTLVLPGRSWLDYGLRPEQVLNRSLRPLLAALRSAGFDAFYPGRDLITIERRPVGHASFTVLPDGVVVVEAHLALETSFRDLPDLLARADPEGVAAVDTLALAESAALVEFGPLPRRGTLETSLADHAHRMLECDASTGGRHRWLPSGSLEDTESAFEAFQGERGPLAPGRTSVASHTMLGAVEVAARFEAGCIADVEISGDLIAPFETVEALERGLEGSSPAPAEIKRAVTAVLSRPGRFLLGVQGLDELVCRLG